ncbi:MAG: 2-oxoglutarate dehydrogenase E1 component [Bdellovibrionales bacterium]|nr:2-oxoglutarate dehydrogenase E1 component [Bdellovibrionales bacterium]
MAKFDYLKSINAEYIDELMDRYQQDPASIDDSWRYFFEGLELGGDAIPYVNGSSQFAPANGKAITQGPTSGVDFSAEAKVGLLIHAYREMGHAMANLDPLGTSHRSHPLLDLTNFGLTETDLERTFTAGRVLGMENAKLGDILARLKSTYCSSIGVEFTHIQDPESRRWLQERMESSRNTEDLSVEDRKFILRRLTESETFERFVHTRYVAQKRFSIEGGESMIPALDRIIEVASDLGAQTVVMGMAHRGRLNVLLNIFGKKAQYIFTEFEENFEGLDTVGIGDVKYHMGYSADITTRHGKAVHLSLANNPSHLEFVNPVVEGIARSKQRELGDKERVKVIPLLIHGDAAFAGQGVVYETLNLSQLSGYRTGGTVHIILNNQVGFTTDPVSSRSTTYATDLAKMLEVPIFHVNGDDPEAVYFVARMCTEYRQKFRKDVFIDLICYRKYGHNEGDDPSFTQPVMYRTIKDHASPRELYVKKLAQTSVLSETDAQAMVDQVNAVLTEEQKITRSEKPRPFVSSFTSKWQKYHAASSAEIHQTVETGVPLVALQSMSEKLNVVPAGFNVHPKIARFLETRLQAARQGKGLDWGNVETLAYASLVSEGHVVRLSGQDAERGTFSHRHCVLNDYQTGTKYTPLMNIGGDQVNFVVRNSCLSETAVLGFEYGWSLADPEALVIWEAQFGDFVNGAQVIIDQFISSSETKWQRSSGLVLYLPHGYEGQGPEHSSARLERFLQLCGENNMAVCNFTTPAQLFHALRRQVKRAFRKPMVVMTPKSLLRHPAAVSDLVDLSKGSFLPVLDDPSVAAQTQPEKIDKVLLCSGKIYYELEEERQKLKLENVAILRLEQLYPWPEEMLAQALARYSKAKKLVWVQEEPRNMGAWSYVFGQWAGGLDYFQEKAGGRSLLYCGREVAAAPANGAHKLHSSKQKKIIQSALGE